MTTLARVKGLLEISSGTTAHDNALRQIITSSSAAAEGYLGRHVRRVQRTEQYDVSPGDFIIPLRGYPLTGTPQFRVDLSREFTGDPVDSASYYVDSRRGIVKFDSFALGWGPGVFQATYTGGMADTTIRMVGVIGAVAGVMTVGNIVEGGTSGARGVLRTVASGVSITIDVDSGTFMTSETLTDLTAGGTVTLSSITTTPLVMAFPDVVQGVESQAVYTWQRKDMKGVTSLSADGATISLETPTIELQPGVRKILDRYRRYAEIG